MVEKLKIRLLKIHPVLDEGIFSCLGPVVWWVIQLNEELVLREKVIIDLLGVIDVVNGEVGC